MTYLRSIVDPAAILPAILLVVVAATLMVGVLAMWARRARQRVRRSRDELEAANLDLSTLRAALDHVDDEVVLLDRELRTQFINRAFRRRWQLPDDKADGRPAFVGRVYRGRDTNAYAAAPEEMDALVTECVAMVRAGDTTPIDLRLASGEVIRFKCAVLPGGGRMLSYTDVTAEAGHAQQVERLATIDELTQVCNRRRFMALAEGEWERFKRYGRRFSLVALDIDCCKSINGRYGHDVGDRVIRAVADWCAFAKRDPDIVGRIGGEEFGLLLPETDAAGARVVAERVRQAIAEDRIVVSGERINLTVSVGVAEAESEMRDLADLIKRADDMLYEAKRAGRNRVVAVGDAPDPVTDAGQHKLPLAG